MQQVQHRPWTLRRRRQVAIHSGEVFEEMSWLISRALMEDYANSPSSPGLVEEYSAATCSDGALSALSSGSPTPQAFLPSDKMTVFSRPSRFGMTFAIALLEYRRKMYAWTKNTDTAKRAIALFAENPLHRETRDRIRNAAQMLVAARCRQGSRNDYAQSAERRSSHRAQDTKPVPENAGRHLGYRAKLSTQWLKSGSGLRCSAVQLSQDAFATKQTAPLHCLGIQLRNCGRTLRRISSQACHGITMERGRTNGA